MSPVPLGTLDDVSYHLPLVGGSGEPDVSASGLRDANQRFVITGVAVLFVSAWAPWAVSRFGEASSAPRLIDLTMSRWVFVVCVVVLATGVILESLGRGSAAGRALAVGSAVVVTVVPILGLIVIELVAMWMSPDRLPETMRRLALGAKPMPGIWLTVFGGALCLVGATRSGDSAARTLGWLWVGVRSRSLIAWMAVTTLGAAVLLAFARYGSWLRIDSSLETWTIQGWAIPWAGLFSFGALAAAVVLGLLAIVRPSIGVGVALSTVGWAITLVSGLTILVGASMPTVTAPSWAVERLEALSREVSTYTADSPVDLGVPEIPTDLEIGFSVGGGALVAFVSGLLVMLGAWMTCRHVTSERDA